MGAMIVTNAPQFKSLRKTACLFSPCVLASTSAPLVENGLTSTMLEATTIPAMKPMALTPVPACKNGTASGINEPSTAVDDALEASGLVRVMPKRGTFVSSWSAEELAERLEVMAEIEASCGRLAARRITEAEMAAFETIHRRCQELAEAGDTDGNYRHNALFHHCIYRATHNAFLEQEAARLHAMLQPYRRMQLRVRNRMSRSFSEHDSIVAAIRDGNAEATAAALRDHVIVQGDRFHDLLSALRQTAEAKNGK